MKLVNGSILNGAASCALLAMVAGIFSPSVLAQNRVPMFEVDSSWPKMPEKWKLGAVSSVAVDIQDHVWILHRPRTLPADQRATAAPAVLEFDAVGNFIQAWGGPSEGYEWPNQEHGIHVDYRGYVWIGGSNCRPVSDDQLLKFTKAGQLVMQIGHSDKSGGNVDTKNLSQPADVFVLQKTNEVFISDGYGNHRMIVLDAETGAFKRMWGAFGNTPLDTEKCPPRNPPTKGDDDPQFAIVHAAKISNDGLVYIFDRNNRRVQVFTIDGKFVTQVVKTPEPGGNPGGGLAFSADPQQDFLYLSGGPGIVVLDRKTLKTIKVMPAMNVHHMATDSKGNIYTADTPQGRAQKWLFKGVSAAPGP